MKSSHWLLYLTGTVGCKPNQVLVLSLRTFIICSCVALYVLAWVLSDRSLNLSITVALSHIWNTHRLIIKYTCGPKSLRWRKSLCSSNSASGLYQTFAQSAQENCRRMDFCPVFKIWFPLYHVTLGLLWIVKAWRGTVIVILPERNENCLCYKKYALQNSIWLFIFPSLKTVVVQLANK